MDRAILPGILSQDDVARGLAAADVAVVPSVRDDAGNVDGLPNVVMESLSSGTPLVATPAGGIGSVVADGVTGLVVPERDVTGLSGAIDRLLTDRALAARLGDTARRWADRGRQLVAGGRAVRGRLRSRRVSCSRQVRILK